MSDPTSLEGLLGAVGTFLRNDLLTVTQGSTAFNVRVCANALDLAVRELQLRARNEAAEHARLAGLLQARGTLEELRTMLCDRIAADEIDGRSTDLREHLWATVEARLAIDQPGYRTQRRKR